MPPFAGVVSICLKAKHHGKFDILTFQKKQRRGNNFIYRSDEIPSQFHAMLNGHSTVNGCQKVNMTSVEDEKLEIEGNMTEPMEYTEEMNSNSVEVNGNKPIFNTKLRAHGHLNSCTTYK